MSGTSQSLHISSIHFVTANVTGYKVTLAVESSSCISDVDCDVSFSATSGNS